jgi:DNA-binding transcriptional LysR family regulator
MKIDHLKNFQVLAKTQNITHASSTLHLAQSALSRCLKNLEEEIDVKLFDRVGKNINLNDSGQIFLKHVDIILDEYEFAMRDLKNSLNRQNKKVVISIFAGSKFLPELICGFKKKHPEITLQIFQQGSTSESIVTSDITISSSRHREDGADSLVLMEEDILLAIPIEHPLAKRKSVKLAEVSKEAFICLYEGKGLRVITDEFCHLSGFKPNIVLETDNPNIVRELVALGIGFSFIPKISWAGIVSGNNMALVEIEEPRCARFVTMKWRSDRNFSASVNKFREHLIEFYKSKENLSKTKP